MGCLGKGLASVLILVMAISSLALLTVKPASAQSTNALSAPTFTVTLTNTSYAVPPSYYIDPQTGANITKVGYLVKQENLTFSIQNQPNITYYGIRWTTPYMKSWNFIEGFIGGDPMNATIQQSSGSTTTWALTGTSSTFPIYDNGSFVNTVDGYTFPFGFEELNFESGAQIEFQVQASNGSPIYVPTILDEHFSVIGEVSDWSSTQTITIPASFISASPSPIPTSTPAVPELTYCTLSIVALFGTVTAIALVFRKNMSSV